MGPRRSEKQPLAIRPRREAPDEMDAEIALNLAAPIQFAALALQRLERPGAVVFVTSGFAFVSPTRAPSYGAVKAGLRAFAQGLRRQLEHNCGHTCHRA